VLAIIVLGLPKKDQRKALRYGIFGAFFFRILAILLAVHLIQFGWVKVIGAAYLLWLSYDHFFGHHNGETRGAIKPATGWLGLSPFWATVAKVELTDIVFAVDSILVAVAMSRKLWVIITGGVLGIIAMRLLIGQLLGIVRRYPAIVDGAYVIVAWVGIKLMIEYLHAIHVIGWEVPRWLSITVVLVLFGISAIYARWKERPAAKRGAADEAQDLIEKIDS
jgi:YkoY family integral membrane protein